MAIRIQTPRVTSMGTPHRCMGDLGAFIWLCRNRGSFKNSTAMVLTLLLKPGSGREGKGREDSDTTGQLGSLREPKVRGLPPRVATKSCHGLDIDLTCVTE